MAGGMSMWRDIKCADVDWSACGVSPRLRFPLHTACGDGGPWGHLTLGELADMGVSAWSRAAPGIGKQTEKVIMATIDMAAEGRAVTRPARALDAYVPKCERATAGEAA
jgi:hypothetical protein